MTPIETTIIQTLISKTQSGALKWRSEKSDHFATLNSANDTRIEVMDIRTGILAVHLFESDQHVDLISLDDSALGTDLLNAIISGKADRLSAFSNLI